MAKQREALRLAALEKGDAQFLLAEAALSRTGLPIHEWCGAMDDATHHLGAARTCYDEAGLDAKESKRPQLSDLSRRIADVRKVTLRKVEALDKVLIDFKARGMIIESIDTLENAWLMNREAFGISSTIVQDLIEELVRALNLGASNLFGAMRGADEKLGQWLQCRQAAEAAYNYLQRAELLCSPGCGVLLDQERLRQLRAITMNNLGCFFKARGKYLIALAHLDAALRLELTLPHAESPATTHLNLCAVLSCLGNHKRALDHAECAIKLFRRRGLLQYLLKEVSPDDVD